MAGPDVSDSISDRQQSEPDITIYVFTSDRL